MSLPSFTAALLAEGHGAVPAPEAITTSERVQTGEVLAEFEQSWRLTAPGEVPAFQADAALWAAAQFYRACQYAVFRNEGPHFSFEPLERESELRALSAAHYSVDLTLRFLPDLLRQVRAAASDDPLCEELLAWSRSWPLSSVGTPGVEHQDLDASVDAIVRCPSLLGLYVDRIIDRQDVSRLRHDIVRQAAAAAIGLHVEIAPEVAAAFHTFDQESV